MKALDVRACLKLMMHAISIAFMLQIFYAENPLNAIRQGVFVRQFDLTADFEQRVLASLVIVNIIIQFRKGDTRRRNSARPRRTTSATIMIEVEKKSGKIFSILKNLEILNLEPFVILKKRHCTGTILISLVISYCD